MTKKIRKLPRTLVSLAGVGGALVAGVVVAAVVLVPVPRITLTAASLSVTPTESTQTRICPGGVVDILSRDGDATTFQGFAAPTIEADVVGSIIDDAPLPAPDNAASDPSFGPSILSAAPSQNPEQPTLLAGAQTQNTSADSISGLTASACGEGSTDQWLVGGSTEVGRTSLLFLSNALDVDATASIEIYGEKGLIDAPGMTSLIVKANSQRIISLAAFAPNTLEPVVHVTTTGGQVLATIQQSVTRVVTASGIDFVQPGSSPARTQVIPGVALNGMSNQDSEGGTVTSDTAPTIRVLVPGATGAEVTATVISSTGEPVVIKSKVRAQHTIQLPFVGVTDGIYTVVVSAEVPIVAGVRTVQNAFSAPAPLTPAPAPGAEPTPTPSAGQATAAKPAVTPPVPVPSLLGGDFTWNAASSSLGVSTLLAIPAGPRPTLTLFNPTASAITLKVDGINKEATSLEVPAGRTLVVAVAEKAKLTIREAVGIHATITYQAVGRGAAFVVPPASRLSSAITVYSH